MKNCCCAIHGKNIQLPINEQCELLGLKPASTPFNQCALAVSKIIAVFQPLTLGGAVYMPKAICARLRASQGQYRAKKRLVEES